MRMPIAIPIRTVPRPLVAWWGRYGWVCRAAPRADSAAAGRRVPNPEAASTLLGGPGPGDLFGLLGENLVCASRPATHHRSSPAPPPHGGRWRTPAAGGDRSRGLQILDVLADATLTVGSRGT